MTSYELTFVSRNATNLSAIEAQDTFVRLGGAFTKFVSRR